MSKLTIDISSEQHQAIKMMAVREGKTIKDLVLDKTVGLKGKKTRELGQWVNQIWVADDFDEWPEDIAKDLGILD